MRGNRSFLELNWFYAFEDWNWMPFVPQYAAAFVGSAYCHIIGIFLVRFLSLPQAHEC
jgi:hypothetical protein